MAKRKTYKKRNPKAGIAAIAVILLLLFGLFLFDRYVMPLDKLYSYIFGKEAEDGTNDLKIHFVYIGQGDAVIIELPDGKNMIIDGGDTKRENKQNLLSYIQKLNITVFDYMLLTHSDADHVGGLPDVLKNTVVKKVYMPDIHEGIITTNIYASFLAEVANEGAEIVYNRTFIKISGEDGHNYEINMLSPSQDNYDRLNRPNSTSQDKNDISPVMLLDYAGKKAVFTGDANVKVENQVLENFRNNLYGDLDIRNVDLFKAGHHGSRGSNSAEFLSLLKPKSVVISCGIGNTHGHPHAEAIDRFQAAGADIYRTDRDGSVVVTFPPKAEEEMSVKTEKKKKSAALFSFQLEFYRPVKKYAA